MIVSSKARWRAKPPAGARLDPTHPLAAGLLGYWPLVEGSGPLAADLAGGHHGTPTGTGPTWGGSPEGGVLTFGGAGALDCGADPAFNATALTVAARVSFAGTAAGQSIVSKEAGSSPFGWALRINGNGNLDFSGGSVLAQMSGTPAANTWHTIAGTYDGATLTLWLDGVSQATGGLTGAIPSASAHLWIGGSYGFGHYLLAGGQVAWVAAWGRALSAAELARLQVEPYGVVRPPAPRVFLSSQTHAYPVSAASGVVLSQADSAVRWIFPAASSGVVLSPAGAEVRWGFPTAASGLVLSQAGSEHRWAVASAASAFVLPASGWLPGPRAVGAASRLALRPAAREVRAAVAAAASGFVLAPSGGGDALGRYQLGDVVAIPLTTFGPGNLPTPPDATPTAGIAGPAGSVLSGQTPLVPLAPGSDGTRWLLRLPLGVGVLGGSYRVTFAYATAGVPGGATARFDVVPGGDPGGAVTALHAVERPEARYILAQLTGGLLVRGRNPRI